MIPRVQFMDELETAMRRSPAVALLGPRQSGKTTLAQQYVERHGGTIFDLENPEDIARLGNPMLALKRITGLIVIDEIQRQPELFAVLRVLCDRVEQPATFLLLGSASPAIVAGVSETLAGRIEFINLGGFDVWEVGVEKLDDLWLRGGFPRSFLAASKDDSVHWRRNFIQTFLERDVPQLGYQLNAVAMRRFWTMLAHYHGQTVNFSELSRSFGVSDKSVKRYIDILCGTFCVTQLQPWHENVKKRQVKAPKIYVRDSGLFHTLMAITDHHELMAHPKLGASWEGFMLHHVLRLLRPRDAYFWATHSGAELDLLLFRAGKRFGIEFKWADAPKLTRSMTTAMNDLGLHHLWVIYPGIKAYPLQDDVTVVPASMMADYLATE